MSYWTLLIPTLVLTAVAVGWDLRTREIPNTVSVLIFLWALGAWFFGGAGIDAKFFFGGLAVTLLGGALMYLTGGFGGVDVKLLAALGCMLGLRGSLLMLAVMAVAGGLLALITTFRGKKTFPYGPAIGVGVLAHFLVVLGGAL